MVSSHRERNRQEGRQAGMVLAMIQDRPMYSIYWWDHEEHDWHLHSQSVNIWHMRQCIRYLVGRGFDRDVSILIDRDPPGSPRNASA